jgi:hypothetical protein
MMPVGIADLAGMGAQAGMEIMGLCQRLSAHANEMGYLDFKKKEAVKS